MESMKQEIAVKGVLSVVIFTPNPDAVVIEGLEWNNRWKKEQAGIWRSYPAFRDNAFLNQGLQVILDRYANIGGPPTAPNRIGVSSDNTAVTAGTTTFGGTFRSNTMNATFPSRSGQTLSFQADFTKGAGAGQIDFSVRKLGITNASTDTAGAVQDIIGGAGVSPYNEPLTIDLTGTTSFTLRPQIDVTLTAI